MSAKQSVKTSAETPVETPVESPVKTTVKPPVIEKKKQENLMYLGPTITGVVRHSTIFKEGILPKNVKECIEQLPMMEKLFVPLSVMPKANKELKKEQSALGAIYTQVANKFK